MMMMMMILTEIQDLRLLVHIFIESIIGCEKVE